MYVYLSASSMSQRENKFQVSTNYLSKYLYNMHIVHVKCQYMTFKNWKYLLYQPIVFK